MEHKIKDIKRAIKMAEDRRAELKEFSVKQFENRNYNESALLDQQARSVEIYANGLKRALEIIEE